MNELAFHDGYLDGLLASKSSVRLFLQTSDGKKSTLILNGLQRLVANDVREDNIILSAEFLLPAQIDTDLIQSVYQYSDERMKKFDMAQWRVKAESEKLKVLAISPSYGCSLLAIFRDYEFLDEYAV